MDRLGVTGYVADRTQSRIGDTFSAPPDGAEGIRVDQQANGTVGYAVKAPAPQCSEWENAPSSCPR